MTKVPELLGENWFSVGGGPHKEGNPTSVFQDAVQVTWSRKWTLPSRQARACTVCSKMVKVVGWKAKCQIYVNSLQFYGQWVSYDSYTIYIITNNGCIPELMVCSYCWRSFS